MNQSIGTVPSQHSQKLFLSPEAVDNWDGILENDEDILWQGAPVKGIRFTVGFLISLFASVALLITAAFFFYLQSLDLSAMDFKVNGIKATKLPFWIAPFSYILLLAAIAIPITTAIRGIRQRSRTFYTLTNKRAFIGTDYKDRQLQFHRFHRLSRVKKTGTHTGSISFIFEWQKHEGRNYLVARGFDYIINPTEVYALVLKAVQEAPEK